MAALSSASATAPQASASKSDVRRCSAEGTSRTQGGPWLANPGKPRANVKDLPRASIDVNAAK
eukprot:180261-Alexandrium_andersonii.AAC.1